MKCYLWNFVSEGVTKIWSGHETLMDRQTDGGHDIKQPVFYGHIKMMFTCVNHCLCLHTR